MRFVLRMAWRETRASWGRLLFFFLCVALGVAAIIVIRSIVQNVRHTLTSEARSLVGADLVVQSSRALAPEQRERLYALLQETRGVVATSEVVETRTMASSLDGGQAGKVRLVELRGVEAAFPFYGTLELEGGQPYSHALLAGRGALVPPEFLVEMGLKVGDPLRLGGHDFTIRGVVTRDRVQRGGGGFAFGPRILVDLADLRAMNLLGFGSSATYAVFVQADERAVGVLAGRLRQVFTREVAMVRTWRSLEDRLGRNLSIAENYLSLVGFAVVVLGGIGVWSVTRVIIQQKIRSVAVLKCLGATAGRVLWIYVLQVLWLASAGSLLGVVLAAAAIAAIPDSLLAPLGVTEVALTLSAAAQGVTVGLLVSLLFALVPLLEVRRVKPLLLLRADTAASSRQPDARSRLAALATGTALVLVAVWQAGSIQAGLYVSSGLMVVALGLLAVSRLLVRATAPLGRSSRFALRHAVISLGRPGNQTRVILMAVGLGCFFILTVRVLQANLLDEFSTQLDGNSPDLVLIDIQPDQVDGVRAATAPYVGAPARLMPLMRARVVGVEGRRVSLPTSEAVRRHGRLTREFGVTYRDILQDNERVTAGAFWTGPSSVARRPDGTDTEVSISEEVREDADVEVGDLVRLDVAGRVVSARVTSIRKVAWDQTQNGGFFFVLRPGPALANVPHSFVGFLQTGADPAARGALQRDLVRLYPNVSAIDVRAVVSSIREILDNVTLGVSIVGLVTLVGGILILVGAVAMTKFQRLYETAIYRTLGASTRLVASMVAVEYGMLGLLAGLLGAGGALAMSWALAEFLFEIEWQPEPLLLSAGVGLTAAAVAVVGLAASADILLRKPLATLRSE